MRPRNRALAQLIRSGHTDLDGITRALVDWSCERQLILEGMMATHGEARHGRQTVEYKAWSEMIRRCTNPKTKAYPRYGGRGIKVCTKWLVSYLAFLQDVGRSPSAAYSLDRFPNNDGNYEPGNVRWATREEQGNNRETNRRVVVNGESLTMSQWAKKTGLSKGLIKDRLNRGWSPENIVGPVSTPKLTPEIRERVILLLVAGLPQKIIGQRVGISQSYVALVNKQRSAA